MSSHIKYFLCKKTAWRIFDRSWLEWDLAQPVLPSHKLVSKKAAKLKTQMPLSHFLLKETGEIWVCDYYNIPVNTKSPSRLRTTLFRVLLSETEEEFLESALYYIDISP